MTVIIGRRELLAALGGAALPQLAVKPGADVIVERLLDDGSWENVGLPAALAILLDVGIPRRMSAPARCGQSGQR